MGENNTHEISNPPNIQETIAVIDNQIEVLLTTPPDLNQSPYSPQIIELRRRRNSLVPLYQLPVELLLTIVWRYLERTTIYGRHYSRLLQLSLVSMFFKDVVDGGSELWAHIGAGLPIPGVETCLVRSRNQPLDINLDSIKYAVKREGASVNTIQWEEVWKVQRAYEKAFVEHVLPHFSRIRVAGLKLEAESWIAIQPVLGSAAPLLEKLKIEAVGRVPFPVPPSNGVDAFSGHAPRLKALHIGKGFHFLVGSYKFSDLSSLSIWSDKTLVVDKIITMLSDSANLSSLILIEWMTARGFDPSLGTKLTNGTAQNRLVLPILLPKLRVLTLRLEGADRVLYLLEHVQGPSCTHLDLRHGRTTAPPHFIRRSLDPFLSAFKHARGWTDMSFHLGPLSGFQCDKDGPSVSIQTSSDTIESPAHLTSLLDWIFEARANQSSNLEIGLFLREQGVRVDCSQPELLSRFHRLGHIVALILDGSTSNQEWIRKLMETNWPTSDENPQFFLPDLVTLYLSGFNKPGKDLAEVLQVRYGKSPVQTGRQPRELPPPLRLLKMGGTGLGSYSSIIKGIVGEQHVKASKYQFLSFETSLDKSIYN